MARYKELEGLYNVGKTIGSGGFAKVKEGTHILTGERVAIKIMDKLKLGEDVVRVEREIAAMKNLQHQHICQLYQSIESDERFFLILEHCPNGELFDLIISRERLGEEHARQFFSQILSALAYMHHCGYAHRDLKPENLLLDGKQNIKLIDFGLCSQPLGGMNTHIQTCCGSPAYAAPELLSGKMYLGREADIWSLGVLLYTLLCGCLPFDHKNTQILFKKIRAGVFNFPKWLREGSRSLISCMLQVDASKRIRMEDLVKHPWVTKMEREGVVKWKSTVKTNLIDHECIQVLRGYFQRSSEELRRIVRKGEDGYVKATYLLLLAMKLKGRPLRFKIYQDVKPIVYTELGGSGVVSRDSCDVIESGAVGLMVGNKVAPNTVNPSNTNKNGEKNKNKFGMNSCYEAVKERESCDKKIIKDLINKENETQQQSTNNKKQQSTNNQKQLANNLQQYNNKRNYNGVKNEKVELMDVQIKILDLNQKLQNNYNRNALSSSNGNDNKKNIIKSIDVNHSKNNDDGVGVDRKDYVHDKRTHHYYETPLKKKNLAVFNARSEPTKTKNLRTGKEKVRLNLCNVEGFNKNFVPKEGINKIVNKTMQPNIISNDCDNLEKLNVLIKNYRASVRDNEGDNTFIETHKDKNTNGMRETSVERYVCNDKCNIKSPAKLQFQKVHNVERNCQKVDKSNPNDNITNKHVPFKCYHVTNDKSSSNANQVFKKPHTKYNVAKKEVSCKSNIKKQINNKETGYTTCNNTDENSEEDDDVFVEQACLRYTNNLSPTKKSVSQNDSGEVGWRNEMEGVSELLSDEVEEVEIAVKIPAVSVEERQNDDWSENGFNKGEGEIKEKGKLDEVVEIKKICCQSPGKMLKRGKNNQRRQRPSNNDNTTQHHSHNEYNHNKEYSTDKRVFFSDNTETIKNHFEDDDITGKQVMNYVDYQVDENDSSAKVTTSFEPKKSQLINEWIHNTNQQRLDIVKDEWEMEDLTSVHMSRSCEGGLDDVSKRGIRLRTREDFSKSPLKVDKRQKLMSLENDLYGGQGEGRYGEKKEVIDGGEWERRYEGKGEGRYGEHKGDNGDGPDYENLLRCQGRVNKERGGSEYKLKNRGNEQEALRKTMDFSTYILDTVIAQNSTECQYKQQRDRTPTKSSETYCLSASIDAELGSMTENKNHNRFSRKLGKGVDRLVGMLTPSKNRSNQHPSKEPKKIKSTHNVHMTDEREAKVLREKLVGVLKEKNICYKDNGSMCLKCTVLNRCNQVVVAFCLEVVVVKGGGGLGVMRKRIQGDGWYYKRLCESILKAANLKA